MSAAPSGTSRPPRSFIPSAPDNGVRALVLLLFFGSGVAALIYQVVWFQLLQLIIGSSTISLAILLGLFMGGMCAGSLIFPRLRVARYAPFRVYAVIELGIGLCGVLVLLTAPVLGGVYAAWAGSGLRGMFLRAGIAGFMLLPPTLLMGATFPAIARGIQLNPNGVSGLGLYYGANIAGGVVGALASGFYLLRLFDVDVATVTAVTMNIAVAGLAFAARPIRLPADGAERARPAVHPRETEEQRDGDRGTRLVLVVAGLSGLCALSAEVVWTRHLTLLFGGSVYTFALITASFLVGLALGSGGGAVLAAHVRSPRRAMALCQCLAAAGIAWAAYVVNDAFPFWPVFAGLSTSIWYDFQFDVFRALWVILPGAVAWGASFPLAIAALAAPGRDGARVMSRLYAANTMGALLGALATGIVLVGWIGSQRVQQLLIGFSLLAALLAAMPVSATAGTALRRRLTTVPAALVAAALLMPMVPPVSPWLVAYGRFAPRFIGGGDVVYVAEGVHDSVAVTRDREGGLYYHNSGKVQASTQPQDMRLQRMLAHLTTLLTPNPRRVFVIGYGAGVTAGAIAIDPRVERVTIAEIEPQVPRAVTAYFRGYNHAVDANPKVRIRVDDERHELLTGAETYDAITSDMVDPWVKGAAMLFTREFFELTRARLNPGGVVSLFVQLYQSNVESVKTTLATFFEVFPNALVFGNAYQDVGYDLVLMGFSTPPAIDVDAVQRRLEQPAYATVAESLRTLGLSSAVDLLGTYAGRRDDLQPWLTGTPINRDRDLRLSYLAGFGMDTYEHAAIYRDLLAYRRFPDVVFTGTPATHQALVRTMQMAVSPPLRR